MKRCLFYILLGVALMFSGVNIFGADDGEKILKKSDEYFPVEAKFKNYIAVYENDQFKLFYRSEGYVKGIDQYLLVGLEPAVLKGRTQLRIKDTIYYYLKKIDKTNQVSAKVVFANSTLTQEDIMSSKLSSFYKVEGYTEEQENNQPVYKLNLKAATEDTAYYKIISYVNPENYFPIRREYFAFSGQKIKEMVFNEIQYTNGKLNRLKFTMYDSLRKGVYTVMEMSDFDYSRSIPNTYFTTAYMKIAAK